MMAARSRTVATWLAVLGGALGLHRFYLHGLRDGWGWLHWPFTLAGGWGVLRMRELGQDDRLAWLLIPLLGLSVTAAMAAALVYGLMLDERWDARFRPHGPPSHSGWLAVLGAIAALMIGATALLSTIAFATQRYFESQLASPPGTTAAAPPGTTPTTPR